MFKHGFMENQQQSNRWHPEIDLHRSVSSYTKIGAKDSRGSSFAKADSGYSTKMGPKNRRQMSVCSQDSCWTLNTEFDRVSSSLASWDEDDYEKETSRRVASMLQELDAALYEGAPLSNKYLQQECAEWSARFPYLRVVGIQLMAPIREKGYCYHSAVGQSTRKSRTSGLNTPNELSLVGHRVNFRRVDSDIDEHLVKTGIEEILGQDGEYEELLAVDNSGDDAELKHNSNDQTPTAESDPSSHVKWKADLVDDLFKDVWPEVERTLIERRGSVTARETPTTISNQRAREPAVKKNRLPVSPVMKKRVPSTALAAYEGHHSRENRTKITTPVSRTAPAMIRGGKSNLNGANDYSGVRANKFTRLPPIDALVIPHLPNVPAPKIQHYSKGLDAMAKAVDYTLDDDDGDESPDLARKGDAVPPLHGTMLVKSSQVARYADSDYSAASVKAMRPLSIGKRVQPDAKLNSRSRNAMADLRRSKTVGVQKNPLIIQGYQPRAIPK